jgi:hypothetical protein
VHLEVPYDNSHTHTVSLALAKFLLLFEMVGCIFVQGRGNQSPSWQHDWARVCCVLVVLEHMKGGGVTSKCDLVPSAVCKQRTKCKITSDT